MIQKNLEEKNLEVNAHTKFNGETHFSVDETILRPRAPDTARVLHGIVERNRSSLTHGPMFAPNSLQILG